MIVGYKGNQNPDTGYFFCPYWPGMTQEDRLRVDAELAERSKLPTEIQLRIMRLVKGEHEFSRR